MTCRKHSVRPFPTKGAASESISTVVSVRCGKSSTESVEILSYLTLRGVTALIRAVSGEQQIYSGNLEILPGIGKPGKFFGKYKIVSGH